MAIATAAAGLLAAVRWTQAKGVDFGAPMVASQAGAFPPGLVTNLFRGFDVCLLTTAPMVFGFSPFWSLLIAAIAALILLNSLDAETLRARQAEQQKQLARRRSSARPLWPPASRRSADALSLPCQDRTLRPIFALYAGSNRSPARGTDAAFDSNGRARRNARVPDRLAAGDGKGPGGMRLRRSYGR